MNYTDYIGKTVAVRIDRPPGSAHPKHGFRYPINYGFVPNTIAEDGDEIDVYVLGIDEPVDQLDATVIAVINRKDDDENKLVATIDGSIPTESEIKEKVHFQEQYFDSFVQFAQQDDESGAAGAAPLS